MKLEELEQVLHARASSAAYSLGAEAVLLVRGANGFGKHIVKARLLEARRNILAERTISQRRWQNKAKRVREDRNLRVRTARQNFGVYKERGTAKSVARKCLEEAIETRERYVRNP